MSSTINHQQSTINFALHPLGEGIWEASHDIRFCGIWLPHRMTVIRLSGGKLLLHSPTRCDEQTVRALAEIGTVAGIIAPNRFHDLFLDEWLSAFPEARLWIPPGTNRNFHGGPRTEVLCDASQDALWQKEVACVPVKGLPLLNEFAVYHDASKSLVLADLLFNIQADAGFATRLAARLGGFYRRLGMPREMRWWFVRDRAALKQSVQRIMDFPFENLIIGHGANVIGNGRTGFKQALRWLVGDVSSTNPIGSI